MEVTVHQINANITQRTLCAKHAFQAQHPTFSIKGKVWPTLPWIVLVIAAGL